MTYDKPKAQFTHLWRLVAVGVLSWMMIIGAGAFFLIE